MKIIWKGSDVFLAKSGCKFQSQGPMGPPPADSQSNHVCKLSNPENPNNQPNVQNICKRKNICKTNFRSSVDDLLRHTPDAVIEPSTIEEGEEEGGTNNLDHTSR